MSQVWEESPIGSGSFGYVRMFTNTRTGEKIALKEMRTDALRDLQPSEREKTKMRLINEIKIMWEHNHDNLIKALCQPKDMHYNPPNNVMHVWMEYCEGGDLRRGVLTCPENCCGLNEGQVRRVFYDINCGIRFLHSKHIIHRDLKPENILIKHIDSDTVVYKLTDFGYAKSYDLSSKAESMVGTPQYVAPEIINDGRHGSTVDFWSFGVVAFELVTGIRPFLHRSKRLFEWIGPASTKPSDCIHISLSPLNYFNCLPQPHQLSSVFAKALTKWLQVALQYNPENRGGPVDDVSSGEAPCLLQMESVLHTKVLNIVCMSKGHILSYEMKKSDCLSSLNEWLHQQGYNNQYLITEDGKLLDPQNNADLQLDTVLKWKDNSSILYLFSKDQEPSFKLVEQVIPSVQTLIATSDDNLHKDDRQPHFGHAYCHLREQWRLFLRLHVGHKAILLLIEPLNKELKDLMTTGQVINKCQQVLNVAEFMKKRHATDIVKLEEQAKMQQLPASAMSRCHLSWSQSLMTLNTHIQELEEMLRLKQDVDKILTTTEVLIERHLSSRQHFENFNTECVQKALDIIKMERNKSSHSRMSDLLPLATHIAENIIQDHLNRVNFLDTYLNLLSVTTSIKSCNERLDILEEECSKISEAIQKDIWSLVGHKDVRKLSTHHQQTDDFTSPNDYVFNNTVNEDMRPSLERADSVASCKSILVRLRSQPSVSSESVDSEGRGDDINYLMSSLKQELGIMSSLNAKEIEKNVDILSRADTILPRQESQEDDNSKFDQDPLQSLVPSSTQ